MSALLPNTNLDNAIITSLGPGLGVTVSQIVPANGDMFYGHGPASVVLSASEQGFYLKPKTTLTNFSPTGSDSYVMAVNNALPPTDFNYGLRIQRVANDSWEFRSFTSGLLLASGITDSEILDGNIAASFSTDGPNITVNAYLNGTASSSPIGSETVLATTVNITDTSVPMTFAFKPENTASEQMTFEHLDTPDIAYDNVQQFRSSITPEEDDIVTTSFLDCNDVVVESFICPGDT